MDIEVMIGIIMQIIFAILIVIISYWSIKRWISDSFKIPIKQELRFAWFVIKSLFKSSAVSFKFRGDDFKRFFRRPSEILNFLFYVFIFSLIFRNVKISAFIILSILIVYIWKKRIDGEWRHYVGQQGKETDISKQAEEGISEQSGNSIGRA